ncbi:MAG: YdiU family protein [Legionella sp.]|uniref:protein adenylyltransferase SelO n=1 Tax=Legionella sp. TaxID=459 RepID=UPI0039E44C36
MIPHIHRTSYLKLPQEFYEIIDPVPIANPSIVLFNRELATLLGALEKSVNAQREAVAFYAGNKLPSNLKSIALAYSGHQFGYYAPLLGDGRATLLGEIVNPNGQCWDLQLKGSGRTRFSRMGDGRAPLSAVLREYIISEAMHTLHIPTTRSLVAIASTDNIYRQTGLVPSGVLTRIASSSLRVGSFEYAASLKDIHSLKCLADYALSRHFPDLTQSEQPYLELFKAVLERQASLIAQWMGVGFIHGVMNTDNMTISGETIDYGPCAFMDEFDFTTVFSSIDAGGRYAYGNQANIAHWNLAVFGYTLLPLLKEKVEALQEALNSFPARFQDYWYKKVRAKLGFFEETSQAQKLMTQFFTLMQTHKPDFTNTFRLLSEAIDSPDKQKQLIIALGNQEQSEQWVCSWALYAQEQAVDLNRVRKQMNQVNPVYIPRNHLVENAINHFIKDQDRSQLDTLLKILKNPFTQQKNTEQLQTPPQPQERVCQTFCGT